MSCSSLFEDVSHDVEISLLDLYVDGLVSSHSASSVSLLIQRSLISLSLLTQRPLFIYVP